jgi:hypothetical protein
MSGRKCETCFNKRLGYCPFDERCRYEVWELYVRDNAKRFKNDEVGVSFKAGGIQ